MALGGRRADGAARRLSYFFLRGRVLPPPFTLVTAPPATQIDIDDHRAAVSRIQQAGKQVLVQIVATRDIYTVGPPTVGFTVRSP